MDDIKKTAEKQTAAENVRLSRDKQKVAPKQVKCYNPVFDVTDNSLISGIVTEKGILRPPYRESIRKIRENEFRIT